MRHEIASHTVVGVIQQNSHDTSLLEWSKIHRTGAVTSDAEPAIFASLRLSVTQAVSLRRN